MDRVRAAALGVVGFGALFPLVALGSAVGSQCGTVAWWSVGSVPCLFVIVVSFHTPWLLGVGGSGVG